MSLEITRLARFGDNRGTVTFSDGKSFDWSKRPELHLIGTRANNSQMVSVGFYTVHSPKRLALLNVRLSK